MHLIRYHQRQDLPDTWDRSQQMQRMLIMLSCGFFDMPFKFFENLVDRFDHCQIDLDAFSDLRVFKSFGHAVMVVFS
jgi:hypothetical protein